MGRGRCPRCSNFPEVKFSNFFPSCFCVVHRALAADAEANMEAVNPPLFLRFVNLLMNDAVFLLDEALSNMASLRSMISAR